jgi:hypothetical protein
MMEMKLTCNKEMVCFGHNKNVAITGPKAILCVFFIRTQGNVAGTTMHHLRLPSSTNSGCRIDEEKKLNRGH